MNHRIRASILALAVAGLAASVPAQGGQPPQSPAGTPDFVQASQAVEQQLADSVAEFERLNAAIAAEKLPLGRQLGEREAERAAVRAEFQQKTKALDGRALDLDNLRAEIKWREDQNDYLSNMLGEYVRNFESRVHIAELDRYREPLNRAKLAVENTSLPAAEVYAAQLAVVDTALGRLEGALGGEIFEGSAIDPSGLLARGQFVLVGPTAIFRSADGSHVGTAEQLLGSLEPTAIPFVDPAAAEAARKVVANGGGMFPFDPTLGNAHKIEATQESLIEHIKKGGAVMVPIFVLAGAALLVAIYKWLRLAFLRRPSRRQLAELLTNVRERDVEGAREVVQSMGGPAGRMLEVGVEHIDEPRELIEEVMYEKVLTTRLSLQSMLPFVAICAAAAPLLGLLGTVTGIMDTFKLITVFGTGDVKTLSSGISVALITTEYGLIVAIPSLLLHSLLSRKARGVVDEMEKSAIAFVNEVNKTRFHALAKGA